MAIPKMTLTIRKECLIFVIGFILIRLVYEATKASQVSLPRGRIHPHLFKQRLSHFSFHHNSAKKYLTDIATLQKFSTNSIAVVGIEWGVEVLYLASLGYHVFAFEPLKYYRDALIKATKAKKLNVTVVEAAAGSRDGRTNSTYENSGITEEVDVVQVDKIVKVPLLVLSLDTQGSEYNVLKGSREVLEKGVAMLWIEISGCNEYVRSIFNILDQDYVLFDFVPWGRPKNDDFDHMLKSRKHFEYTMAEERDFDTYLAWMCELKRSRYTWIQTDIIAIRRTGFTRDVLNRLRSMADSICRKDVCVLRELMLS